MSKYYIDVYIYISTSRSPNEVVARASCAYLKHYGGILYSLDYSVSFFGSVTNARAFAEEIIKRFDDPCPEIIMTLPAAIQLEKEKHENK